MTDLRPGEARILDRGYQHYTGPRGGVGTAIGSVVLHSVQRALGQRRPIWAKVLPVATILIACLPAIVFVGGVALFPVQDLPANFLPSYGEYYRYVIAALMVFVALVAPEVLCTDRRTGMLGVYLSSPLDRDTYLVAKAISIAAVLSLVCLGPPLLMLVANVLQSQGPNGFGDIALTLVRVLGAGTALTLLYTGVTMGVASLTDRKSVAMAGIILLFLVSLFVTGQLTRNSDLLASRAGSVTLLSLDLAARMHGESNRPIQHTSSLVVWGAWFAWTAAGFGLARYQLRHLQVTR